jgi:hypothetical protein
MEESKNATGEPPVHDFVSLVLLGFMQRVGAAIGVARR